MLFCLRAGPILRVVSVRAFNYRMFLLKWARPLLS